MKRAVQFRCCARLVVASWALLCAAFAGASSARADVVVIHDRGKKIKPQGQEAEDIKRICADLLRRTEWRGGPTATETVRILRADEVVVEVHYDEPQEFELGFTKDRARPQHLLVSLTGPFTGLDGDTAQVFVGRTPPKNEPTYLGFEYYNPPDEYGVQYGGIYYSSGHLEELRQQVAQLGVDAPRPTPWTRPTPDLTPMRLDEK